MAKPRLSDWLEARGKERTALYEVLASTLPRGFEKPRVASKGQLLPEFFHAPSRSAWLFVPRLQFRMGLSASEERQARALEDPPPLNLEEMRPTLKVEVAPFLMMKEPVSWSLVERVLGKIENRRYRPEFPGPDDVAPAYLTLDEVARVGRALGFSLPLEAEWECACRAGTDSLFFFGDSLPSNRRTLEGYVTSDMRKAVPNAFGFRGMFVGAWCKDHWRPTYDSPADPAKRAVRGGGSAFSPWQASEWAFCVSAMRMPSSDLVEGYCGARFVVACDDS